MSYYIKGKFSDNQGIKEREDELKKNDINFDNDAFCGINLSSRRRYPNINSKETP